MSTTGSVASTSWREFSTSSSILYTSQEISSNNTNTTATSTLASENSSSFLFALILQLVIILVVLGNALVLSALSCFRQWTSADVLLFSLSLADLLDSILALEMITMVKYFLQKPMAKPLCDVFVGLVYTFRLVSCTTVTFIAIERAVLVTHPFRHHTLITPSRIKKLVFGIWIFSIFSSILPFIGVGHSGFHDGICFSQIYDLGKAYAILIEVYGISMMLVVFCSYLAIKLSGKMFIRRQTLMAGHSNMIEKGETRTSTRTLRDRVASARAKLPENTSGVRSVRKLTVMMGMVVVIYYISWLPFLLNNLFCLIVDQEPAYGMVVFTSLISMLHALANPPLYGWMSQRYRRGYFFVFKMALSLCGGHRPSRRSLSVSRRYCTGPNLSRQATCTEITLTTSRLSLPQGNLAFTPIAEDKEQENHLDGKSEVTSDAHVEDDEFAERADETAGADNSSLVSMEVIKLLDAIIERIEE